MRKSCCSRLISRSQGNLRIWLQNSLLHLTRLNSLWLISVFPNELWKLSFLKWNEMFSIPLKTFSSISWFQMDLLLIEKLVISFRLLSYDSWLRWEISLLLRPPFFLTMISKWVIYKNYPLSLLYTGFVPIYIWTLFHDFTAVLRFYLFKRISLQNDLSLSFFAKNIPHELVQWTWRLSLSLLLIWILAYWFTNNFRLHTLLLLEL